MTEVCYDVLSKGLGCYDPRTDRIILHEGLRRFPLLLGKILDHEWGHVEISRSGENVLSRYVKNLFLDYRCLWNIYRDQELLGLFRRVSYEIDYQDRPMCSLVMFLIPKVCYVVNWMEGLR